MIEKIDLDKRNSVGVLDWFAHWNEPSAAKLIEHKINELVDAVNSIVSVQEKLIDSRFVVETKHEEPTDPYAEQRKWIGKLCRVESCGEYRYGILKDISASHPTHPFNMNGLFFRVCEPVKPDDDIIFKGE